MTAMKILVVEDDEGVAEALQLALEDHYEVLLAANGREALAVLATTKVDAIILDLMMPIMDGETFLQEYRRAGGLTPVVIASAALDVAARAAAAGAQEHLRKP